MSILTALSSQKESARVFCIDLAREYGVRALHFKPANAQERRWQQEGVRPIEQFETVGNMIAERLCE